MNASPGTPLRVLMLEDSRFDAELVGEAVHARWPDAALCVACDEAGFVDALAQASFDIVLSDYELPGYGGPDALAHASRAAPRTPFIFVSGVIGEENAVEMLKRGATDYVSKNRLARLPVVMERALREVAERAAREAAERQLRAADAVYGRVVDALADYAVILLDADGAVRDWNRGASAIFGMRKDKVLGAGIGCIFTAADRAAGVVEAELETARRRGSASDDRWLQRADGSLLRADGVLTALRDESGHVSGFCKIVRDVTPAYASAAALRDAKEDAERANRAKDRFLAVLSHELRTPLAPIASAAALLEQQATVPPGLRGLLPMIRRNVALEARLIEDLLDVTAISAGRIVLRTAPLDMRALAARVVDMVDETIRDKRITLAVHWDASRSLVDGDEARLQQVLWNIVRNAAKFTPEGGRIELRADNEGELLRLRCIDDGIGISPISQQKIFSAFEQADADVSRRFGGLGLGLAIAQGLVAEHHGTLEVASGGPGQGSTFTLRLATLPAEALSASPAPADAAPAASADKPAVRMLLVEDNEDAAFAMTLAFEYYGYRVTHADTLVKALAAARADDFDVVVTDLGLPDGSGIALGEALSARLPVIALSGFGSAEDVRRTTAAGFARHLVKPADPEDIHAVVMSVLAQARTA